MNAITVVALSLHDVIIDIFIHLTKLIAYDLCDYFPLQSKFEGSPVSVSNLTTDWNSGIAVATLVNAVAPGLCPECVDMKPQNALQNATHAMQLAEDWLGIPQVNGTLCLLSIQKIIYYAIWL